MNILFICRHNRFRSRVAEAYFNKINKNKKNKAKSAGLFIGKYPLSKLQVSIAKKLGISINGKPKPISTDLLKQQDMIVIVADDVPAKLFRYSEMKYKILIWKIKDEYNGNKKNIENIIKSIMKKVDNLVKVLK